MGRTALAWPCAADVSFFTDPVSEPTFASQLDPTPNNPMAPFSDRLAFDWACYHYVRLQSSADEIHKGLDLWHATVIKHQSEHGLGDGVPWVSADELYATIDSITAGDVGWTVKNQIRRVRKLEVGSS